METESSRALKTSLRLETLFDTGGQTPLGTALCPAGPPHTVGPRLTEARPVVWVGPTLRRPVIGPGDGSTPPESAVAGRRVDTVSLLAGLPTGRTTGVSTPPRVSALSASPTSARTGLRLLVTVETEPAPAPRTGFTPRRLRTSRGPKGLGAPSNAAGRHGGPARVTHRHTSTHPLRCGSPDGGTVRESDSEVYVVLLLPSRRVDDS